MAWKASAFKYVSGVRLGHPASLSHSLTLKSGGSDIQTSRGLLNFLFFLWCPGLSASPPPTPTPTPVCSLRALVDLSVSFGPVSQIESTLYSRLGGGLPAFVRIAPALQHGVRVNAGHHQDKTLHAHGSLGTFDLAAAEVLGTFQSDEYEDFYRRDVEDLEDVGVNVVKENNQAEVRTPSKKRKRKKKGGRERIPCKCQTGGPD